jgi:hypothetical protein
MEICRNYSHCVLLTRKLSYSRHMLLDVYIYIYIYMIWHIFLVLMNEFTGQTQYALLNKSLC